MFINGGSNLPSGSSPCSRHEIKERREPLEGKDNGGNCTPSWLISTKLPPDSPEIREFIDKLTHLFPMHPSLPHENFRKPRFSDVFRGRERVTWEQMV